MFTPCGVRKVIVAESDPIMDNMRDGMFFGDFVRLHILYHATKKPISGLEIVAELERHGYRLRPGKVCSVLQALEQSGYLTGRFVAVGGKRRKYYEATGKGRQVMRVAKTRLHELAAGLLKPLPDLSQSGGGNQSKRCLEECCDSGESDLQ